MKLVIKEAARILEENPELKHYEALNQAKLILKEKETSSDGRPKKSQGVKKNNL